MGDGSSLVGGNPMVSNISTPPLTLWSAADRGNTARVRELLYSPRTIQNNDVSPWRTRTIDVNARNCLGCTPLLYACGSGHLETVSTSSNSMMLYNRSWHALYAVLGQILLFPTGM